MLGYLTPKDPTTQSAFRNHFIAATGEFVGTFMFLLMAFLGHSMAASQAPESGPTDTNSNQTVIFIAMAYGFSLLVTAWTMYRISGGLFNPAVTLGMVLTGTLPWFRGLILFPVQIISGICAAGVASAIIPGSITTVQTTLAPGVSVAQGVFLEMFLTAELVFTVLMLAAEKTKATFIAPIGIGMALFVAEIAGVYYTGGSLNPARSFGPCVAGRSFQHYHWIYWIGPFLGAIISGGYYHFVKFFNYEAANPGQDSSGGTFDANIERQKSAEAERMANGEDYRDNNMDSRMENGDARPGAQRHESDLHPGYNGNRI
ncbi:hypothetical protein BAUCODRAFT_74703 [Baudoinia panamericana UAMH 10762]|uniref:Aquaporin n=1 Tax=Baudoinia panamericana (strain UAMH 10762) TaxID=717646 RepID=M2MBI8_BAUPA|nr:uncharacterized protein BAUCODRAFT_74703 [Baudoinia panamericana UAMH 10762]EMC93876.1 hypothetical protein BAUCODRAFT_74703 [Baudoinia panamericana UAMH 10762]